MFILLVRITSKSPTVVSLTSSKKALVSYFLRNGHYLQFSTNLNPSCNRMQFPEEVSKE